MRIVLSLVNFINTNFLKKSQYKSWICISGNPGSFRKRYKQGVQRLKAFAFRELTIAGEHTKPRFKRKLRG